MRKYLKIIFGLLRLFKEFILNGNGLKLHGIMYCICSGVKIWSHQGGMCDLGRKTWLSENCYFESAGGKIKLGSNNFFNSNCRIIAKENINIGDDNLFGPNVVIVDHNHNFSDKGNLICNQGYQSEQITVGSDVWVGANVTICLGVTICNRVVIGANSVVTKSINKSGVYAGLPAKLIKEI